MVDASILELHKENIQPLMGGRPASKLADTLVSKVSSLLLGQREKFEKQLQNLDDLDDPLQVYCDYVEWTHTSFPQGSNAHSGLLLLLEKCTLEFRDIVPYKNDPRYLKIWLEYKDYLDSPRDIFIYLAKKEIGRLLALYYEQFADFLEANGDFEDSQQVYEMGIQLGARPIARLTRSYNNFMERSKHTKRKVRSGLSERDGVSGGLGEREGNPSVNTGNKRQKLQVFNDTADERNAIQSIFNNTTSVTNEADKFGTIKVRTKENVINAKPWAGEILTQRNKPAITSSKIPVYRDLPVNEEVPVDLPSYKVSESPGGQVYTLIEVDGKKPERINLNLDKIYGKDEEFCLDELVAIERLKKKRQKEEQQRKQNIEKSLTSIIIPLKDEDEDSTLPRPNSPTLTMFSRIATNEVLNMFNSATQLESEDEDDEREKEDNSTNYDGFVTETIDLVDASSIGSVGSTADAERAAIANTIAEAERIATEGSTASTKQETDVGTLDSQTTPPTDQYDTTNSSPFLERPSSARSYMAYDPSDGVLRDALLSQKTPMETIPGYHDFSSQVVQTSSNLKKLQSVTNPRTKIIQKGSQESIINYLGDEILSLRYELGKGGYGTVYLAESETGKLKALKIETPATKWEFYILNEIHKRLDYRYSALVIKPESLFCFKDESYLILNYVNQGTILDIVNFFKNKSETLEESIIIWITIELFKIIEALHGIGILHGDLKADNCMIRLNGENAGGVTLIDFGRSIDLTLFGNNKYPKFISHWKADQQDCPQMNNGTPWSYEADYYGVASIIHTMLFGKYIEITNNEGQYALKTPLKRYWQTELWGPIFEILLNPGEYSITDKIKSHRIVLQDWILQGSVNNRLKDKLRDIEVELSNNNKKLIKSLQ